MINYSIIIPHKNIPHLLERCLASIPRRDDIEIIVVDDNSDPDIVEFDNFPGIKDKYVKVIFDKNENGRKGAGYARNLGLEVANGKWLVFADADDYFTDCFENALDKCKDNDSDIIIFKVNAEFDINRPHIKRDKDWNNMWELLNLTKNREYAMNFAGPIAKFIKQELIVENRIRFQEVFHSNDVMFSAYIGAFSKKVETYNLSIYCITVRDGSLTSRDTVESLKIRFNVACDFYLFRKSLGYSNGKINPDYLLRMKRVNFFVFLILSFKYIQLCGLKKYLSIFEWYRNSKKNIKQVLIK